MKIKLYIIYILGTMLFSCSAGEQYMDLPPDNEPVFYLEGLKDGSTFKLIAGDDGYQMHPTVDEQLEGASLFTSGFVQDTTCEYSCGPGLIFEFFALNLNSEKPNIEDLFKTGPLNQNWLEELSMEFVNISTLGVDVSIDFLENESSLIPLDPETPYVRDWTSIFDYNYIRENTYEVVVEKTLDPIANSSDMDLSIQMNGSGSTVEIVIGDGTISDNLLKWEDGYIGTSRIVDLNELDYINLFYLNDDYSLNTVVRFYFLTNTITTPFEDVLGVQYVNNLNDIIGFNNIWTNLTYINELNEIYTFCGCMSDLNIEIESLLEYPYLYEGHKTKIMGIQFDAELIEISSNKKLQFENVKGKIAIAYNQ